MNVENQDKQNYLTTDERSEITTTIERLESTPFTVRWMLDYGWAYGIGNKRISPFFESREKLIEEIEKTNVNWNTLAMMIDALVEYRIEMMEIERRANNEH